MFESFNRILHGEGTPPEARPAKGGPRSEERLAEGEARVERPPRPTPGDITERVEGEFLELKERNHDTYMGEVRRVARYSIGDMDQTTPVTYPGWESGDFRELLEKLAVHDPDVASLIPPEARPEVREAA